MALTLQPVASAQGWRWVRDGFVQFGRKPLAFTSMLLLFLLAATLVSVVPLVGGMLALMALPLLSLGFMLATQTVLQGGQPRPAQLWAGLAHSAPQRRALLMLCALYGLATLGVMLLGHWVDGGSLDRFQRAMAERDAGSAEMVTVLSDPRLGNGLLLRMVLLSALSVPFWHAPALIHWAGQGLAQSLFSSTLAVWRCRGAFFVYALAWAGVTLVFGVLLALVFSLLRMPQLVGLVALPAGLALSAVFYVSLLFTFSDSFGLRGRGDADKIGA